MLEGKCTADSVLPNPETTRGPCRCTGLAVIRMFGASVAHSTFAGTHAGRRKVIAVGEWLTHHDCTVECPRHPVNTRSLSLSMHDSPPTSPSTVSVRVAFQGEPGAYSELAIKQLWPHGATAVPSRTFADALARVHAGDAAYAVLPVVNAIAGPVMASQHALHAVCARITMCGETRVDIHLCLLATPGSSLPLVRVVRSHPMALAQSQCFFQRHDWLTAEVHDDTAGAAREVAHMRRRDIAAIASSAAAARYGLHILAKDIEDRPGNWTRFVMVSARSNDATDDSFSL